ncbi:hypothetical protein [Paenibacillus planticolens]|uniref:Tail assembly chaperone n=1 Tax=Paenibacillus planticolens TaxID=2654976 RepID=A0ABX1ZE85_9BACL|nr:hypothetical protein [Paenibacillus planticolens]NOU98423.1 hypothetical protein [Paenibacillus planticolens]
MTQNNVIKSITLTPDFRLTTDGDRNFILERRHTVDPTKAPGFERRNAEAIEATGAALPTEKRDDWREDGYYGFTAAGLSAALSTVAVRSAWAQSEDMADYIDRIAQEQRRLTELTSGLREAPADETH